MSSQNTGNSTAFIEAQQYSQFILENLHDGLMPAMFVRDVSDFSQGTTLNIKTIGSTTLQEVSEDQPIEYNPIDTGNVTLSMTDYIGDGWAITDKLRQDGAQIESLLAMRGVEATRAIQEYYETRLYAVANAAQTAASLNLVNGRPHRVVGASASNTHAMTLANLIQMKLSFDKANVPQGGRIAFVDPIVEATLNTSTTLTTASDSNPQFQGVFETGFAREHKFVMNIMGWDIYTSNRLPVLTATEAIDASSYGLTSETAAVGDVANIFMSVADDNTKPIMSAWRQQPSVEGERNKDLAQDEFVQRARFGLGAQRTDTIGVVLTSPTAVV